MDASSPERARRPRIALLALGCRVSRADVDALAGEVETRFDLARDGEAADVVVVNTCAVTGDARSTARKAIRRAAREHPGARIVASGCYAALAPDAVARLPGVAAVVAPRDQTSIAGLLLRLAQGEDGATALARASAAAPARSPPVGSYAHARPLLKVQDGCDARCSFCVVPAARGASRSMPLGEAVERLVALGTHHPEVVLTGVHLGAYGRDLAEPATLSDLVRAAVAEGFGARLRLSSIEPEEFPADLLEDPHTAGVLCEHFHLPLQSGSARLLAAMRRPCAPDAYRAAVRRIASLAPGACVGADVLVGFPGETDADHRATVALIESLPLAYLHVFPFSPRPGARGAGGDAPPAPVVRERVRELLELSDRRWRSFLDAQVGRELEVVVERADGAVARGTSRQYAAVRWPSCEEARGALVRVRVEASDGAECVGVRAATARTAAANVTACATAPSPRPSPPRSGGEGE